MQIRFDIRKEGRTWDQDEALKRYYLAPEKLELHEGKLLFSEEDRLILLGMLLENVGVRKAIQLCEPSIWREALDELNGFRHQ